MHRELTAAVRRTQRSGLAAVALALAAAGPALAVDPSTVVVASVSGQAPARQVPFFGTQTGFPGGLNVPAADVRNIAQDGPHVSPNVFQAEGAAGAKAQPGLVILNTEARVSNEGPGNVGNVSAIAISGTTDVITINGPASEIGRHLTLHGKIAVDFSSEGFAFGAPSGQFPDAPIGTDFADADEISTFTLASNGIEGGLMLIGEEHRGINNETGETFDEVRGPTGSIAFSLDVIVGTPIEISFLGELSSRVSVFDAQPSVFGGPGGERGNALADATGDAQWINDDAFLADADTGRHVLGLSVSSTNGFDWLGDGVGPTSVPEPAAWTMMIAGLGLSGASLRRRRSALSA